MRRAVLVSAGVVAAGAGLFGLVKATPILREAIGTYRHVFQAASQEPAAREAWAREFGDPGKARAAYSKQTNNAEAVHLLELVQPLGSGMIMQPGWRKTVEPAGDRALNGAFADYIRLELSRTTGAVQPPPETVRTFLETCRTSVDAIVDFLSVSEAPAWEAEFRIESEAPGLDLLWQMMLQRVLIADALDLFRQGKAGDAEEALNASWTLNGSLRERPDVLSQMVAVSVARMHAGLVRRIPVDPAIWHRRLADHDYRVSMLRALEVESLRSLQRLPTGGSVWDRANRTDFLDLRRAFLVRLRDSRVSDRPIEDPGSRGQKEIKARTLGAILERMSETNEPTMMKRVHRLILDTELSALVLEARVIKARRGHWPSDLAGAATSRFEGGRWNYSVDRDERMTISYSPDPHWENPQGILLPTHYRSDRAGS